MPRKTAHEEWMAARALAASMRPRPDAAENGSRCLPYHPRACRFNEAAARCRGKQRDQMHDHLSRWTLQ